MTETIRIALPHGPGAMAIHTPSGDPIVTIRFDGRIDVNPAFTLEEAARAFWDAVIRLNPYSDLGLPLNTLAGQIKLGARDQIVDEAFVAPELREFLRGKEGGPDR